MAMAIGLRGGHTRSVRNELDCQSRCPTKILWHVHESCRAESARTHVSPPKDHTRPETGAATGSRSRLFGVGGPPASYVF